MKIDIGKSIKEVRQSLGLTQEAFSKRFNRKAPRSIRTHPRDISKYETYRCSCPVDKYLKFMSLKK